MTQAREERDIHKISTGHHCCSSSWNGERREKFHYTEKLYIQSRQPASSSSMNENESIKNIINLSANEEIIGENVTIFW